MYKHLFLEGPIQTGKSTLLRKLLEPYKKDIGGFTSQRMIDNNGSTIGFRIGPAATTELTIPFDEGIKLSGVFRLVPSGDEGHVSKAENFPEIFDTLGVSYLKSNSGKKLILLDEIGGLELAREPFRKSLYHILNGDTPCIGVIKLNNKAASMTGTSGYRSKMVEYNEILRIDIVEKFNGKIIRFERDNSDIENEIKHFLSEIFTN